MEFHSETDEMSTTASVGPHVVFYASDMRERRELETFVGLVERCTPPLKANIAETAEEFSVRAKKADHALLFLDSASAAARHAIALGEAAPEALSKWLSRTKKLEQLLHACNDTAILVLKDGRNASELASRLGLSLPLDGDSPIFGQAAQRDPIIDCIAEIAVRRAIDLPSTISGVDVLGLESASKLDSLHDLSDLAANEYYRLHSRIKEIDAEFKTMINQVIHVQYILNNNSNLFRNAIEKVEYDANSGIENALFEELNGVGDQRRLEMLRPSMLHKPTVANIGPLTPQVIPSPFLRNHLRLSKQPVAHEVSVSPDCVSQSPPDNASKTPNQNWATTVHLGKD